MDSYIQAADEQELVNFAPELDIGEFGVYKMNPTAPVFRPALRATARCFFPGQLNALSFVFTPCMRPVYLF